MLKLTLDRQYKAAIYLRLSREDGDFSYSNEKKRELAVNKVKTTPKNFKSVLKTVLFSTADLLLLRGNPSDRRDWLERAI